MVLLLVDSPISCIIDIIFQKIVCVGWRMEVGVGRRAAALGDTIDNVLIAAGVRATEQLKSSWPKLSAASLNKVTNAVPLLLGVLALAAMCTTPSMIVLSIFVVLPIAFRVWVVTHSVPSRDPSTSRSFSIATNEEWPVYSVIAPLRGEARMVDQLLSAIERLDYPPAKLDVILAVEADDSDTRAAITARQHRIPITVIPSPQPSYARNPRR